MEYDRELIRARIHAKRYEEQLSLLPLIVCKENPILLQWDAITASWEQMHRMRENHVEWIAQIMHVDLDQIRENHNEV